MQVVTLTLSGEMLALPTRNLREILDPVPVTRVPRAGRFAFGPINVRGAVIPLTDLCVALGMTRAEPDEHMRMLVLDVSVAGEDTTVAMIADRVLDVTEIDEAAMGDTPRGGHEMAARIPVRHRPYRGRLRDPAGRRADLRHLPGNRRRHPRKAAEQAGEVLASLLPDIERTSEPVTEISRSNRERATGAAQVNLAIQQLDKITQQNTSASEEPLATAEELASRPSGCRPRSRISG